MPTPAGWSARWLLNSVCQRGVIPRLDLVRLVVVPLSQYDVHFHPLPQCSTKNSGVLPSPRVTLRQSGTSDRASEVIFCFMFYFIFFFYRNIFHFLTRSDPLPRRHRNAGGRLDEKKSLSVNVFGGD